MGVGDGIVVGAGVTGVAVGGDWVGAGVAVAGGTGVGVAGGDGCGVAFAWDVGVGEGVGVGVTVGRGIGVPIAVGGTGVSGGAISVGVAVKTGVVGGVGISVGAVVGQVVGVVRCEVGAMTAVVDWGTSLSQANKARLNNAASIRPVLSVIRLYPCAGLIGHLPFTQGPFH